MTCYAHSTDTQPPENWHRLEEHLRATAEKASQFATPWGAGDWAWNAGWLHDLGKADSRFQRYLLEQNGIELNDRDYDLGRVNHSSAGAACAEDYSKPFGRVLAYLVAGHHAGLPGNNLIRSNTSADGNAIVWPIKSSFARRQWPWRRCLVRRYRKLHNTRQLLLRAARETDSVEDQAALRDAAVAHETALRYLERSGDLDSLRGREGDAARAYFGGFAAMVKRRREVFGLKERSRRPPRDPMNALLSFLYALLRHDVESALLAVGLDPATGYLHADRPGRPSLALDMQEELRAPFADRLALALINREQLKPDDFREQEGGAWRLRISGQSYQAFRK